MIPDDFEALIRIFSEAEGGRRTPVFNGIRWDLGYADDPPGSSIYMIWPDFLDDGGDSLISDGSLPVGVEIRAAMTIVAGPMRAYHRGRIQVGTRFFCQEGSRRVAEGRVTRITNLPFERGPTSNEKIEP